MSKLSSTDWDARYAGAELVRGAGPNRFVVREFTGRPPGRALDLAAGEGRNALWLAEQGWQVLAVDFSAVAIERAHRLATERGLEVNWVVADVLSAGLPERAFDAVLVAYLHLPAADRAAVLARAAAALAPGGTLLVVGHDRSNLTEGGGGPRDPDLLYTPDEIVDALPSLDIRRAGTVLRPVEGSPVPARDTLVVATRS
jgi:2-polyprenyl-3-methyl-5-hydroxy-6-metoxy-1,4-benzoquinol methylase